MESGQVTDYQIGIITISDTRDEFTDFSGPAIEKALKEIGFQRFQKRWVKDETISIRNAILELSENCDAIFTTGGTGFMSRDVTPEATLPLLEKRAQGLETMLLISGLQKTPFAGLSRGVIGVRGKTLIVNLPGSQKGAQEGIEALKDCLMHILNQIHDISHEDEVN